MSVDQQAVLQVEGISKMLNDLIRSEIKSNPLTAIGGALAMPAFRRRSSR